MPRMITAKDLKAMFESSEYVRDLDELSAYAASIKQERPMVLLLSKYLHGQKGKYKFAMERSKCDLIVNDTRIEFKFHYDFDMLYFLKKELDQHGGNIEEVWKAAQAGQRSKTWGVIPGICKDMLDKDTHIFVWIICERNLRELKADEGKLVCAYEQQQKYNEDNPYGSQSFREIAECFLGQLGCLRQFSKFSRETAEITTRGFFPSRYHLNICEFTKRPRTDPT